MNKEEFGSDFPDTVVLPTSGSTPAIVFRRDRSVPGVRYEADLAELVPPIDDSSMKQEEQEPDLHR